MADQEKIAKAKIVLLILGILVWLASLMMESMLNAMQPTLESMGVADMITPELITIFMILYITAGILIVVGALLLPSNLKVGKILIILGSIITIKDLGIVVLIVALIMLKGQTSDD